jgi:hypothetical protein
MAIAHSSMKRPDIYAYAGQWGSLVIPNDSMEFFQEKSGTSFGGTAGTGNQHKKNHDYLPN